MCFFKFYGTTDTNLWMDFKERYKLEIKTIRNKNYISIGGSVRTNKRTARNNGGAARQENRPQSATAYSSERWLQV